MSNRTFACLHCRKLQRKPQTVPGFCCPHCGRECVCVPWKLHVPAPGRRRKWDAFWKQYFLELRLIEQFEAGLIKHTLHLPLINQVYIAVPDNAVRKLQRRNAKAARRRTRALAIHA